MHQQRLVRKAARSSHACRLQHQTDETEVHTGTLPAPPDARMPQPRVPPSIAASLRHACEGATPGLLRRRRPGARLHDAEVLAEDGARLDAPARLGHRVDVPEADLRVVAAGQQVALQEGAPRQAVSCAPARAAQTPAAAHALLARRACAQGAPAPVASQRATGCAPEAGDAGRRQRAAQPPAASLVAPARVPALSRRRRVSGPATLAALKRARRYTCRAPPGGRGGGRAAHPRSCARAGAGRASTRRRWRAWRGAWCNRTRTPRPTRSWSRS